MRIFEMSEILEQRRRARGSWVEFFRVPAMSLGVYVHRPGEDDAPTPHTEDELCRVLDGRRSFRVGDTDRPVRTGSPIFVEERTQHPFRSITEELTLLVLFAPAEDMEAAKGLA